ncbi:hypothetical protein CJ030_MR7G017412 [Morella rubra]|uniref:Uncharacterized protein n=1 Tax=Morella rubra TaxID=262757 RepID=A0A6A1V4X6_9ROSI|nr:hypothetical protein CJ030_MR7G017412 [Morella rubra]
MAYGSRIRRDKLQNRHKWSSLMGNKMSVRAESLCTINFNIFKRLSISLFPFFLFSLRFSVPPPWLS